MSQFVKFLSSAQHLEGAKRLQQGDFSRDPSVPGTGRNRPDPLDGPRIENLNHQKQSSH